MDGCEVGAAPPPPMTALEQRRFLTQRRTELDNSSPGGLGSTSLPKPLCNILLLLLLFTCEVVSNFCNLPGL